MKDEVKEKITAAIAAWDYIKNLPETWQGFVLKKDMNVYGDVYDIYSYSNEAAHRKVTVYYHEETKEYKLRVQIGLTEFCRIEFISETLEKLEQILRARFEQILADMAVFNIDTISCVVREKQILDWNYLAKLPNTIQGFTLFIDPQKPVKVINGSYIIFDYSDFATSSNFIIYYNVFRDEFFGEAKIHEIPEMNYTFDSTELIELEEKLDAYFLPRLKELRERLAESPV